MVDTSNKNPAPTAVAPPSVSRMISVSSCKSATDSLDLSSKQFEDLMDDDCHGPVSNGDPMLSSPHLSPNGVMSSPASSSHYSTEDADGIELVA
jgi:hypothetical protein